ncbi:hypothetical protein OTU49_002935 [Cherax quadricarinatus]|uniref:C2H2-type domain-containing protein n=1 Tax=Cherax quadricarinatus TaxID=27406 RepID=A0AAW0XL69_CHEQU|nr:zinc finger protein 628-like [Cherax quadricarinatus]
MRTDDVMNQAAAATAGIGTSLLALGGAISAANAKGSTLTAVSPVLAFDLTAYTQLLQQVASKMYTYDPASVAALAALSPASHLPLALTAPHALSLTARKVTNADKTTMTSVCSLPDNDIKRIWHPSEKSDIKIKEEDGEAALDLTTQGLKSLYSSYRRATLDDIKPKVVEDIWIENDLRLSWTDSRVAAYNPAQKLFMCVDCECVGFLSRVAEHWLGAHANLRVFACPRCPYTSAWSRCVKMHLTRQHNEQFADTNMWKENSTLMEVTRLMQELRNKVENRIDSSNTLADKRFYCPHCPYATDRRDLYTRHENIHKDDKPFHCYLCFKQFNRADHVKKHFVRMHPETEYDISKIRKQQGSGRGGGQSPPPPPPPPPIAPLPLDIPPPRVVTPVVSPPVVTPPVLSPPTAPPEVSVADLAPLSAPSTPGECSPASPEAVLSVGTGMSMISNVESPEPGRSRRRGERAYTCPYCHWSGSDNWCLKRHMNTHIKPFACVMCDYKAARAERLSTHVWKVHNKRICNKCNYLAETQERLLEHTREEHHNNPYSRRYICSSCGLTFDTRPALETHQHLSHPHLTSPTNTAPLPAVQDVPHDLSIRSEVNSSANPVSYPFVCPVEGCGHTVSSGGALAEHVRTEHGGASGSCCPHCGYQLTHDELSRDHWLTHHNEVCAACVHVFTAVYGPQLWKKVHVRPASLESSLDAIVTGLNRKRTATDVLPTMPSVITPLALVVTSSVPQRDSPSPESDQQDTDSERFNKRSRKQSCPKKVITVSESGSNTGSSSNSARRRSSLRIRHKAMLNRPGFLSRQCHRCSRRPVFGSRARLQLHVKWSHGRHSASRQCQPHRDHSLPAPTPVH